MRKISAYTSDATLFVYDQQGHLLGEYDPAGQPIREYAWLGDQPIAVITPDPANPPKVYYIHADHLNTPRVITDKAGNERWTWWAEPFGTDKAKNDPSGLGAFTMALRFPGQYYDIESGMHYNYQQDYIPGAGRYAQSDPIGLAGGINTYSYAAVNPLSYTDSRGLFVPALGPLIIWGVPAATAGAWAAMNPGAREALGRGWDALTTWAKPPANAYDPNDPKAPGKPGEAEGFSGVESWVRNPNGRGYGWQGADGGVWCPTGPDSGSTGDAHGGPHWDVQYPDGRYDNVYPGGRRR